MAKRINDDDPKFSRFNSVDGSVKIGSTAANKAAAERINKNTNAAKKPVKTPVKTAKK